MSDHDTCNWNWSVHWIKHARLALCASCSQRVIWAPCRNTWTSSTSKRMCNSREHQTFEQIILCQTVVRISKSNVYTCPEVSGSWRLADFQTTSTWKISSCQPYAPATFTPQKIFLVLIYVRGLVDLRSTVQPAELSPWKITMTASGIEPAIFRPLAQYHNHMRHRHLLYKKWQFFRGSMKVNKNRNCNWRAAHVLKRSKLDQFKIVGSNFIIGIESAAPWQVWSEQRTFERKNLKSNKLVFKLEVFASLILFYVKIRQLHFMHMLTPLHARVNTTSCIC
jgi:hypothetical protein